LINKKNVIVTGASGFLGSAFYKYCQDKKWSVRKLNLRGSEKENLRILNCKDSVIFHFAEESNPEKYTKGLVSELEKNLLFLVSHSHGKFIYISSIYAKNALSKDLYVLHKRKSENWLNQYPFAYVARLGNIIDFNNIKKGSFLYDAKKKLDLGYDLEECLNFPDSVIYPTNIDFLNSSLEKMICMDGSFYSDIYEKEVKAIDFVKEVFLN